MRFHPERPWTGVYLTWLENIRPWCISRQLWWGHQLPVWYRGDETYVGESEPPAGDGWERDPDVLDTWFSSGLWPFATLGWPEDTPELRAFYPTDVHSTARDIIFLWVARMVMFGIEFTGEVPFTDVNIHSVIQAPDGRRMSKSLGTGIDPLDLIDRRYGADAARASALLAMSSAQDVRFNEERVKQGQDLANKLWNASRLILLRVADVEPDAGAGDDGRGPLDRVAARAPTARVTELLDDFRFSHAALDLYGAFWSELCDWYLELAKPRLYEDDNEAVSAVLLLGARAHAAAAAPGDAVRDRGDLVADARRARPAGRGRLAGRRRVAIDEAAEAEIERLIEAVTGCAATATRSAPSPPRDSAARLAADGYEGPGRPRGPAGARFELVEDASDGDVLATCRPRRRRAGAALRRLRPGRGASAAAARRATAEQRDRARREEARQRAVRRARRRPRWWRRSARKLDEYREALRAAGAE